MTWWTFTILGLSSQPYSEQSIQSWLRAHVTEVRLASAVPDVTVRYHHSVIEAKQEPYRFAEFVFRKSAHLFVYALLAGFAYWAMRPWLNVRYVALLCPFGYVLAVSVCDEWNQAYASMRTSAIEDVAVDMAGGFIGLLAAKAVFHIWNKYGEGTLHR